MKAIWFPVKEGVCPIEGGSKKVPTFDGEFL